MHQTKPALRLVGGFAILLIVVLGLLGVGSVASAEPSLQAATATTTPAAVQPTCVTAAQGIVVVLNNPQPGDTLLSGVPVNMSGIAYDTASTSGSGISSVTLYLGARDAGGLSLGTALLGQPNPQAPADSQFATAGFTVRTPSLPSGSGGRSVFVYARSAITNTERVLEVPVYLNTAPTPVKGQVPTAVLPTPPPCTPTPVPTATATATTPPAPAAAVVSTPTAVRAPTLAPVSTLALPSAVGAATPAPAVAAPAPAAAATTAPIAAQATAPRGGGIPAELGMGLVTAGALVLGGGVLVRRRQRLSRGARENAAEES